MESIRVAVRIRPEDSAESCIKFRENVVTISRTKENSLHDTHEFNFDRVRTFLLIFLAQLHTHSLFYIGL